MDGVGGKDSQGKKMAGWYKTSQWHEMFYHDPEVMGWNLNQAERGAIIGT